jgi:hypothetical protein
MYGWSGAWRRDNLESCGARFEALMTRRPTGFLTEYKECEDAAEREFH